MQQYFFLSAYICVISGKIFPPQIPQIYTENWLNDFMNSPMALAFMNSPMALAWGLGKRNNPMALAEILQVIKYKSIK